jgi:hypothetical protein
MRHLILAYRDAGEMGNPANGSGVNRHGILVKFAGRL